MEKALADESGTYLLSTRAAPAAIRTAARHATRKVRIVIILPDSSAILAWNGVLPEAEKMPDRYTSSTPITRLLLGATRRTLPAAPIKAVPFSSGNFSTKDSGTGVRYC